jgi:hypothetical protein
MVPIPVTVVGMEREQAGVFGAWVKHVFAGTEGPRQLVPQDVKRKRAVIVVAGAGGIYIGTPGQVDSVAVATQSAGEINSGMTVTSESASEQWILPKAATTVSVLVERYL